MTRYAMLIDVDRCTGCYSCYLACRDEHSGNDHPPVSAAQPRAGQNWIRIEEQERGTFPKVKLSYVPVPCLQCANAACVDAARDGALYRRDDGIVVIDPQKAVGQRQIVDACPYGAIAWNEGKNLPQKCTFCAHLLDEGWTAPRCVAACPTDAITFGDLGASQSDFARRHGGPAVEDLRPEFGMKPLVRYLGLPRRFLAGEIAFGDRPEEPAAGVAVSLCSGGQTLRAVTDAFGDFEFAALEDDAKYVLRVEQPGYRTHEQELGAPAVLNVGTIVLAPAS